MAHSSKDALVAAKQELLAAYSTVHNSLGRFITLVKSSEPRAIADALGSDYEQHLAQSPQDLYPRGSAASQAAYGSRPPQYSEPANYAHPRYPAPPQPHSASNVRTAAPPGPCFTTVTPGAPRQQVHAPVQAPKSRQRKGQAAAAIHPYASQSAQPLETDDDEEDEDEPEEPVSEEDHPNGTAAPYFNPPRQPATAPTPPGSIPGAKKKRGKRERDPNAPKRPASAYILFQNAVRNEMRAANPTADYKELARQIGDRWKNLTDEAKRPWSEAGKLAMNSWNIQNKEYKISHPETTSPHNQASAAQAPVARKKRSRVVDVDAQGNPLPKKRGRPSKAEKDLAAEQKALAAHPGGHQVPLMSAHPVNGSKVPPAPQPHMASVQQATQRQHPEEAYSEDGEEEEEEEDAEEDEEDAPPRNYAHARSTGAQHQGRTNGASQIAPPTQHSESDLEDGDEDDGSEPVSGDEPNGVK